ncbi:MAG: beta-ketoacyl synthase N-terminal-like domain-containing protein [Deferrisomatales bacterium]|nr:beta-ketoacyl synthase N-terminal-like domain-containing protein [Deferrisomatales bacterium]
MGMVTAVGGSAAQTASSVRAGISRYEESSIYNSRFSPMTLALFPDDLLPPLDAGLADTLGLTSRQIRMLRLAGAAVEDLAPTPEQRGPLFLAGPEPLPGLREERPAPMSESFLDHLAVQTQWEFDRDSSRVFPTGRAAGMQALAAALETLEQGTSDYVFVGGVDTYLDLYLLGTLDMEGRVLAEGVMDGFCPGEGAAFLLLASQDGLERGGLDPIAFVAPPGIGQEPGHRYSEEPYQGDGLAQVVALALGQANVGSISSVLCSQNGENFGTKEWGVTYLRNSTAFIDDFRFEHPAEYFGDVGGCFGPALVGLAAVGVKEGYLPGPCLVCCSSEEELRGACVVTPDPKS